MCGAAAGLLGMYIPALYGDYHSYLPGTKYGLYSYLHGLIRVGNLKRENTVFSEYFYDVCLVSSV